MLLYTYSTDSYIWVSTTFGHENYGPEKHVFFLISFYVVLTLCEIFREHLNVLGPVAALVFVAFAEHQHQVSHDGVDGAVEAAVVATRKDQTLFADALGG